jgi:hypothetical protein
MLSLPWFLRPLARRIAGLLLRSAVPTLMRQDDVNGCLANFLLVLARTLHEAELVLLKQESAIKGLRALMAQAAHPLAINRGEAGR